MESKKLSALIFSQKFLNNYHERVDMNHTHARIS